VSVDLQISTVIDIFLQSVRIIHGIGLERYENLSISFTCFSDFYTAVLIAV
jgi:hypothetical protein